MLDDLYFKDAFTQTDNGINVEANQLSINCLTSNNNKFSLDSEGNLQVNSITTNQGSISINYEELLLMAHPVGSIYMSTVNESPQGLFGGTWMPWGHGMVPVGIDASQTEFNTVEKTGGSKYIQDHYHKQVTNYSSGTDTSEIYHLTNTWNAGFKANRSWIDSKNTVAAISTGNSGNLQPYITCYMWKRIS